MSDKEELDDFDATLKLMEKRQLIQKQLSMLEAEEVNKEPAEGSTVAKSVRTINIPFNVVIIYFVLL